MPNLTSAVGDNRTICDDYTNAHAHARTYTQRRFNERVNDSRSFIRDRVFNITVNFTSETLYPDLI